MKVKCCYNCKHFNGDDTCCKAQYCYDFVPTEADDICRDYENDGYGNHEELK